MKRVSTRQAAPAYLAAFREILSRIERTLKASGAKLAEPVKMYVAGGAALHFYTGARISEDIDASFSRKVLLPPDLEVTYRDVDGTTRLLYFDRQYNDTFGLLHESADNESLPLDLGGLDPAVIDVRLLSPLDLAVSKLARFDGVDQQDIRSLAEAGLLDAKEFRKRAKEALTGYVGPADRLELSIQLAGKIIADASTPRSSRRTRPQSSGSRR
jgi:hypothetical protein